MAMAERHPQLTNQLLPAARDMPLPLNCSSAQRIVTMLELERYAKVLECESGFKQEQKGADFLPALANYHLAFWRWVLSLTPPNVIDKLKATLFTLPNTAETKANIWIAQWQYLIWRAVFVAGMKAGEGSNVKHYLHFAHFAQVALKLDDGAVFDLARQHRYGRKPKPGYEVARKTKFALIVTWLVGGVWRMSSRDDQAAALQRWWNLHTSSGAIQKAQTRLGLKWYRGAPD